VLRQGLIHPPKVGLELPNLLPPSTLLGTRMCIAIPSFGLRFLFFFFPLFSSFFLLHIFLNYISNAIPKVPHTFPPNSLPTHSLFFFFGPGVPLYWSICLCVQWASLSSDGRLGHLLIHMQLESRAPDTFKRLRLEIKNINI
jgi:hypothetical protein